MFKKLKQKLEEGVANSPVRAQVQQKLQQLMSKDDEEPEGTQAEVAGSQYNTANSRRPPDMETPKKHPNAMDGQLFTIQSDGPALLDVSQSGPDLMSTPISNNDQPSVYSTPAEHMVNQSAFSISDLPPTPIRSRTSSIGSVSSDAGLFSPVQFTPRQYVLPSDVESEVDEQSSVSLGSVSKEDLYNYFRKMQRRSEKYKGKFVQLMNGYKEVEREREKLRTNLTTSQDKAFRRISELKEQIQLDKLAKRDLESNYQLMLEEKDELVKVLQTQILLLKEGKELPEELVKKASAAEDKAMQPTPGSPSSPTPDDEASVNTAALKDKVRRLEVLLTKCKETIKNNKERTAQVNKDRDALQKQLEEKDDEFAKLKNSHVKERSKLHTQMKEARALMESLETDKAMLVAETKQQMHVALEGKDQELEKVRASCQQLLQERDTLNVKMEKLETGAKEQLEKSREIIKQLSEEKKRMSEEMSERIRSSESQVDQERADQMMELKRGKAAALSLMQQEMDKKVASVEEEKEKMLKQHDEDWALKLEKKEQEFLTKLSDVESEYLKKLGSKDGDMKRSIEQQEELLQQRLKEREEDMKLAIEERDLQKMAALGQQDKEKDELKNVIELMRQEKIEIEALLESLKAEHKQQIQELVSKIEENSKRHKETMESLSQTHTRELERLKAEHAEVQQKRIYDLRNEHQQTLESMVKETEEKLACSTSEIDAMYKGQAEQLNSSHEQTVGELHGQIDLFRKQVGELEERNKALNHEITEKTEAYEAQVKQLKDQLAGEINMSEKTRKEIDNLVTEFKEQKDDLNEKMKNMKNQAETLRVDLEKYKVMSDKLSHDCEEMKKAMGEKDGQIEEKSDTIRKTEQGLTHLKSDLENKEKELQTKVEQYEDRLKSERQAHQEELSCRLELVQLQQQTSADEVTIELSKQLTATNEKISSQELLIQEYKMKVSDLQNQAENTKSLHENKITALTEDKNALGQNIEALLANINSMNNDKVELEEQYEKTQSEHTQALAQMKEKMGVLKEAEIELREQVHRTQEECEAKLISATEDYSKEITRLSGTHIENQTQLQTVIHKLEAARAETSNISNNFQAQLDEQSSQLEIAHQRLLDAQDHMEKLNADVADKSEMAQKELNEKNTQIKELQDEIQHRSSELEGSSQQIAVLEQNLATWQTTANEKEVAESDLLKKISGMETQAQQHREALQEKIVFLEKQVLEKDSSSSEVYMRMEILEKTIVEKESLLAQKESQLQEVRTSLEKLAVDQQEGRLALEKGLDEKSAKISQLENQIQIIQKTYAEEKEAVVKDMQEQLHKRKAELEAAGEKFNRLREEAKNKIKELKAKADEGSTLVTDKDKQIEAKETEMRMRIQTMLDEFEAQKADIELEHQAAMKVLTEKLEKEREEMTTFKENVTQHNNVQQAQVKETMNAMKLKFEENLKNKQEIFNEQLEKAEKIKEQEKLQALKEREAQFQVQIEDVKAKTESQCKDSVTELEARHEEVVTKHKAEIDSLTAKLNELTSQYKQDKQGLSNDTDKLKAEVAEQMSVLSNELDEIKSQNEKLFKNSEMDREMKQELEKVQSVNADLEKELGTVKEKYETELQEKTMLNNRVFGFEEEIRNLEGTINSLHGTLDEKNEEIESLRYKSEQNIQKLRVEFQNDVMEKQNDLEIRMNEIKENYEKIIEDLRSEHAAATKQQLEELEENNNKLQEHANQLGRKQKEIKDLQEKFLRLKEKAQVKIEELRGQLDSKVAEAAAMTQQIEATKEEYENRIAEMVENDIELQSKLKELTLKLNDTEEQLQELTQTLENTVEGYKRDIERQKTQYEEQMALLVQKVEDFKNQSQMSTEEFQKNLESKLEEKEKELYVKSENHAEEISKLSKTWKAKLQELKQSYSAKLKEAQNVSEIRLKELEDSVEKEKHAIGTLQEELEKCQCQLQTKGAMISELESKVNRLEEEKTIKLKEVDEILDQKDKYYADIIDKLKEESVTGEKSKSTFENLQEQYKNSEHIHSQVSQELNAQIELLQSEIVTVKSDSEAKIEAQIIQKENIYSEFEKKKNDEIDFLRNEHANTLESRLKIVEEGFHVKLKEKEEEGQNKLTELKKKAETRFMQIKKQLEGNKEKAIAELNESNAKLQETVSSLEAQLTELQSDKYEVEAKLEQLIKESNESQVKLRGEFNLELKAKESVMEENLKKTESQQEVEVELRVLATNLKKEKEDLNVNISTLEKENKEINQKLVKAESSLKKSKAEIDRLKHDFDVDMRTFELERADELEKMKAEYEGRIEDLETDHNGKIKQLVKEFNLKVAEKERDFQDTFSNAIDKGRKDEDKMAYEHRKEMEELIQDLHEKDLKMEELIDDYEVQLQAKDETYKADMEASMERISDLEKRLSEKEESFDEECHKMEDKIREELTKRFESRDRLHLEEVDGLSKEWDLERKTTTAPDESLSQELVRQNQLTLNAIQSGSSSNELLRQHVIQLTKQVEELKMKHKMEIAELKSGRDIYGSRLPRPLLGGGESEQTGDEGSEMEQLELANMEFQAQIIEQSGEMAKVKINERELKHQVESLQQKVLAMERGETPPASPYKNSLGRPQGPLLNEPTEMEYLRNILYEYMMGRETKTLARVIATVLRFSDEQTRRIVEQEDSRNSKFPFIMGGGGGSGALYGSTVGIGVGCGPPNSGRGIPPHIAASAKLPPPPKMKPRNEDKKATPVFV